MILMKLNRSVKDGSPRLLFDYVLKEMEVKVGKAQYHAMMRVQSSLKFLELARFVTSTTPSTQYQYHAKYPVPVPVVPHHDEGPVLPQVFRVGQVC